MEVGERVAIDNTTVIIVMKDMIKNSEIDAKLDSKQKLLKFHAKSNIHEIETLMKKYQDWEKSLKSKKDERK